MSECVIIIILVIIILVFIFQLVQISLIVCYQKQRDNDLMLQRGGFNLSRAKEIISKELNKPEYKAFLKDTILKVLEEKVIKKLPAPQKIALKTVIKLIKPIINSKINAKPIDLTDKKVVISKISELLSEACGIKQEFVNEFINEVYKLSNIN